MRTVSQQRCDELRVQYMQDMSIYSKDMFILDCHIVEGNVNAE